MNKNELSNNRDAVKNGVGKMLQSARESKKFTIEEVSDALKIRRYYLQAIENGQLHVLPEYPFTIGFIRSCARYYDLDEDEIVRLFKNEWKNHDDPAGAADVVSPPVEIQPSSMKWLLGVSGAGMVVFLMGLWFVWGPSSVNVSPTLPESASSKVEGHEQAQGVSVSSVQSAISVASASTTATATATSPVTTKNPAAAPADTIAAQQPNLNQNPASKDSVVQISVSESSDLGTTRNPGATQDSEQKIELLAKDLCWVEIRSSDGQVVFAELMQAGTRYVVPNQKGLRLKVGDPKAINLEVNGISVAMQGQAGTPSQVILNADDLLKNQNAVKPEKLNKQQKSKSKKTVDSVPVSGAEPKIQSAPVLEGEKTKALPPSPETGDVSSPLMAAPESPSSKSPSEEERPEEERRDY